MGWSRLSLDELHTAIEVESITCINSRPLSYVSSSDMEEPLTPLHLLVGRRVLNLPDRLGYSGSHWQSLLCRPINSCYTLLKYTVAARTQQKRHPIVHMRNTN